MSSHEGEKTTTMNGLKRSEVLRQTEDGAFEFIVDELEEEGAGPVETSLDADPEPAVRALRPWRKRLLIGGPIVAVALVVTGVALTRDSGPENSSRQAAQVVLEEVPGFRPYGGGEAVPRPKPAARRAPTNRPAAAPPVEEFDDEFYDEEEFVEEVDPRDQRWAVGNKAGNVVVEEIDPDALDPEVREEPSDRFKRQDILQRREVPSDLSQRVTRPEMMRQLQEQNIGREPGEFNPGARIPPQIRETMLQRDLARAAPEELPGDDLPVEEFDEDYGLVDPLTGEPIPDTVYEEEYDPDWEEIDEENY